MRDYTYNDMLRMQEEAAERVREMKRRATIVTDEQPQKMLSEEPESDDMNHSLSVEGTISRNEQKKSAKSFLSALTEDEDALLILSLILILSGEESDTGTVLSLLYLLF